ncbi:MAG: T9SS type A sorting domain-containing protein [Flavobacteriaceae bacterium]|nr:T9SS type A sorting domain-containing protein [Flavobacteriaceae bacterium]
MKKITTCILAVTTLLFLSCSKEKESIKIKELRYKREKKVEGKRHKMGIEHMADYFKQISKPIGAKESAYEPGFLYKEYLKAQTKAKTRAKSNNSPTAVFTERGPSNVPGRTRGMVVDPNDKTRWFVGSVGGGVWLTEDEGATWTNLTDGKIPNLATSVIAISPQDSNTLYVGTGEPFGNLDAIGGSGVFKTVDGGTTWTNLTATADFGDIGRMIVNPNNKNNVLVSSKTGIYRTNDGGTRWTRTYDSSGNWVQDLDADPSNFNIQYGSVKDVGVVKSTDGGVSWSLIFDTANFNANHSRFELSVSPVDNNYVYLSVYSPTGGTSVNTDFYISKDKGANFTSLSPLSGQSGSASNLLTGQGWYDNIIMAHPFQKNVFYVGGVALFKVTMNENDDTFSFQSIASGYDGSQINTSVHVDQHGLEYIPGTSAQEFRILLSNDGGVYSTGFGTNPGATQGDWSSTNVSKNTTQFYGATKQNGEDNYIAGAQDNGSWISFDDDATKTKTYTKLLGGDGFEAVWHYDKPGDFIVASQRYGNIVQFLNYSGKLVSFPDAGNSSLTPFYSKLSNADNNPDVVFAISTNGVWRSPDFGTNWNLSSISNFTPSASSSLNVEVSVANPNIVWAGAAMTETGSYALHVSQDNGITFTPALTPYFNPNNSHNLFISGIGLSPTNENRAYALFSASGKAKILKTENLGGSWTDISGFSDSSGVSQFGFPDVKVHCLIEMPYDENVLWVGTDIGLLETTDGGASWNLRTDFISVAIYDMRIVNDQVVFATHGRGVWSATVSELSNYTLPAFLRQPTVSAVQKSIESNKAVISYSVPSNNVTRTKLFVDGVEKSEVTQTFNTSTTYTFETEDLTEGKHTYAVQLFDDNASISTIVDNSAEVEIIDFNAKTTNIAIAEFTPNDIYAFDGTFKVDDAQQQFTDDVINNSTSPYQNSTTYSFVLKTPLEVDDQNAEFTYEDIAIVEPFDNPTSDLTQFWDYVTIEASSDLKDWILLDKYDARRFNDWLNIYNSDNPTVSDTDFKTQQINLLQKGVLLGGTYVFRFSLVTDPAVNSLGWYIKSINATTASIKEVIDNKKDLVVYPTISNGNFTVFANSNLGETKISIFDVTGKQVYNDKTNFGTSNKLELSVNLKPGVYFVNLIGNTNTRISKKIIIK